MIFTVIWTPTAEREPASFWNKAEDRAAVSLAANTIDALLRSNPQTRGESRLDSARVLFVSPLGIDFDVKEEDRIVYVRAVWIMTGS